MSNRLEHMAHGAEAYDDYELSEEQPEDFGCIFPDRCVMPGIHYPNECHTAEMMEAMEEALISDAEAQGTTTP